MRQNKVPESPDKLDLPSHTRTGVNWTAAFLLFCKGVSLAEIAEQFDVELLKLTARCRAEDWAMLMKRSDLMAAPPVKPTFSALTLTEEGLTAKMTAISDNREAALKVAKRIRAKINALLDAYDIPDLVTRLLPPINSEDLLRLAKAAQIVDGTSMMALNDEAVTRGSSGAKDGAGNSMPAILINIPSAMAGARGRSLLRQAEKTVTQFPVPPPPMDNGLSGDHVVTEPDEGASIEMVIVGPTGEDNPEFKETESGIGVSIDFNELAKVANPDESMP